jgi:hypothetical protein
VGTDCAKERINLNNAIPRKISRQKGDICETHFNPFFAPFGLKQSPQIWGILVMAGAK